MEGFERATDSRPRSLATNPRMNELADRLAAHDDDRLSAFTEELEEQETLEVAQINDQLRKAIEKSGLTYYKLAQESGVDQVVISRFVNRERDLRLETAARLAAALGLTLVPGAK